MVAICELKALGMYQSRHIYETLSMKNPFTLLTDISTSIEHLGRAQLIFHNLISPTCLALAAIRVGSIVAFVLLLKNVQSKVRFLVFLWSLSNVWSLITDLFPVHFEVNVSVTALRLVCEKYVRKRKGAVKMRVTVLKMRITCKQKCDQNVKRIVVRGMRVVPFPRLKYM